MVTVGGIIGGGLRLVRDRPISVLVWGFLYMAFTAAGMIMLLMPFFQMMVLNAGQQIPPDPYMMLGLMGKMYLFYFALMILLVILMAAATRAVLRPEDSAFAYLRIGMDELRLIGLNLLLVIGTIVLVFILAIVLGIALAATGAMSGGRAAQMSPAFLLMMLAIYAVPIFVYVRLSPALALTMIREKIVIGEAWRLSSGHFWKMFAGYLVLNLILMAAYLLIVFAIFMPLMSSVGAGATPQAMAALMQGNIGGNILSIMIGGAVVLAILSGVGIAFLAGGFTAATQQMLGTTDIDYAATFE
jgi:hypothetical protein